MKYSEKLLGYFHHRAHAGRLDAAIPSVYRAQAGHGENREIVVLMVDYQEQIIQARFQAAGSVALIAAGEFICGWLEKKTWPDLQDLTPEFILKALDLTPVHIHVANLIVMAVKDITKYSSGQA